MMMARVLLRSVARRGSSSSIVPRRNFSSYPSITNGFVTYAKEAGVGFVAYAKHNRIVNAMCAGACFYTVPECISLSWGILEKIKSRQEKKPVEEEVEKKKSGLYQAKTQVPRETVTVAV